MRKEEAFQDGDVLLCPHQLRLPEDARDMLRRRGGPAQEVLPIPQLQEQAVVVGPAGVRERHPGVGVHSKVQPRGIAAGRWRILS